MKHMATKEVYPRTSLAQQNKRKKCLPGRYDCNITATVVRFVTYRSQGRVSYKASLIAAAFCHLCLRGLCFNGTQVRNVLLDWAVLRPIYYGNNKITVTIQVAEKCTHNLGLLGLSWNIVSMRRS